MKTTNCNIWILHNKLKTSMLIESPVGVILINPVLFNKVASFYSRLNHKGLFK
jgi:hypothetical protein